MTKKLTVTVLLLFVVLFVLCGCFSQPFAEQAISSNGNYNTDVTKPTRELYVSGAVRNDGYITAPQLCDYKIVLNAVGVTDYTVMPINVSTPVPINSDMLIFGFQVDKNDYPSVNVNGLYVTLRFTIDGVDEYIINKLADFIELNGKITNRDVLKLALGVDYENNYYKFYIDINDYA